MFKTGDVFVYGSNGACVITDIKQERFARETKTYYILTPYINRRETIFVPVDSEALTARMKKVLTQDEIIEMIKSIPSCDIIWLDNANARREEYKRIINAAERKELLRLIKTLREKKAALEAARNFSAYVFFAADQPYLTAQTVSGFLNACRKSGKGLGCVCSSGETGNPAWFDAKYVKEFFALEGDRGGKAVIKRHTDDLFLYEVENAHELEDIDFLNDRKN